MQSFEGVSLDVLLNHVQAEDGTIRAVALNDYAVTIPTSDAIEGGPIVAYSRNSRAMSVRDKGPLWIIYPYDTNEAYQSEEIYARSIWQLNRLEIVAQ
ncbi:oxidoreductase, molybdopterin binding [Rhodobacteraceae bacterium KLH11]|nr:oxidoreductase, molybdopterin binding [Rhodobacteraceae bacterium KLH11]